MNADTLRNLIATLVDIKDKVDEALGIAVDEVLDDHQPDQEDVYDGDDGDETDDAISFDKDIAQTAKELAEKICKLTGKKDAIIKICMEGDGE